MGKYDSLLKFSKMFVFGSSIKKEDISKIDPNSLEEIEEYAFQIGFKKKFSILLATMTNQNDKKFWLDQRLSWEGDPTDKRLLKQIQKDGKINKPVILDTDLDFTVSGRHRLYAGYHYNIPVPIICLYRK